VVSGGEWCAQTTNVVVVEFLLFYCTGTEDYLVIPLLRPAASIQQPAASSSLSSSFLALTSNTQPDY
jgi:hypothetical protein